MGESKHVQCRQLSSDEKKTWNSVKVDTDADNNSEAMRELLSYYEANEADFRRFVEQGGTEF